MPFARPLGMLTVLALLLCIGCDVAPPSPPPVLPELAPLEATVGAPYEARLTATGGRAPLSYTLEPLPPGLLFYTDSGALVGTPQKPGTSTITVRVTDAAGGEDVRSYPLRILPALGITTLALPAATAGQAYAVTLSAQGGVAPLSWSVAGALPEGLTLSAEGQLQGSPRMAGSFAVALRVRDARGGQVERSFGLEVRTGSSGGGGGTAPTFTAANWNIEWFGSTTQGPSDEPRQLKNVREVVATVGADFWGLQELVDGAQFEALKQGLPGYDGFLANDPGIPTGPTYYSPTEQKVGFLFRTDVVSVLEKKLVPVTSADLYAYGSRPPLQVRLRVTGDGKHLDLVVLVLHMKAFADSESYTRRMNAGKALKQYLDAQLPDAPVIVLGDWNDDVDESITLGTGGAYLPTPYQNFLEDPAAYGFPTRPLSLARVRSTVSHPEFIDHQLLSNELMSHYVGDSTQVVRPDAYIPSYRTTTTDHYPVLSRFTF